MNGSDGRSGSVSFGQMLRRLRHDARLSQEELAELAGLSAKTISNLERGCCCPYRSSLEALSAALGLNGQIHEDFLAEGRGQPRVDMNADDTGIGPASGEEQQAGPDHQRGEAPPTSAQHTETAGPVLSAAPRTLPRDIANFTGRTQEMACLSRVLQGAGSMVGVQAIGGMAGVGKTAFAVHTAHLLAPRFPHGQLFLPLHGHTPGHRPVEPADALASLLTTMGVVPARIPPGLEERAALWRDHMAGRQVLLVLDDAISTQQVRPLLPGAAGSLVLVTSRRHLTALEDAWVINLDVLPPAEAAALFTRLAGRTGLDGGDSAVAEICRLCGCLPLAIGMVARQLHHHQAWTPADLAADLTASRDRLDLMETENVSVAAGFDLSYADLTPEQQRLFRRLSLHPGSDIDTYAAAALVDLPLPATRRQLAALYDHYLLAEPATGRYRLHDLIREHAHTLATRDDPLSDRDQALGRLLDYYTHAAALAEAQLARETQPSAAAAPVAPPAAAPDLPGYSSALVWARAERANLLACLNHVTETGQLARVVALTAALAALLRHDGPWTGAITRHVAALDAARQLSDRPGEANALNNLGAVLRRTADCQGAARALDEALDIYRDLGDRLGQANALYNLGTVLELTSDYPRATEALRTVLGIYRDLDNRLGQANALDGLGGLLTLTGQYPAAAQALDEALGIYRDLGDRLGQASVLIHLGALERLTGNYPAAAEALQTALDISRCLGSRRAQGNTLNFLGLLLLVTGAHAGAAEAEEASLSIFRDLGSRCGQAYALTYLGAVRRHTGDYAGAAQALMEALDLHRDLGDRGGEAEALNYTGALYRVRGDLDEARSCHRYALDLARAIGASLDEAQALAGLGRCALAAGDAVGAKASLREAQAIFHRIGAAEAAAVTAELDALPED